MCYFGRFQFSDLQIFAKLWTDVLCRCKYFTFLRLCLNLWCILLGGDDRRVLLWNVCKAVHDIGKPVCMKGEHNSNIFCLAFNNCNDKIFSGGRCILCS